jgi:hypothetical protein
MWSLPILNGDVKCCLVTGSPPCIRGSPSGARADRLERQRQGVDLAKRAGKYTGRQANTLAHETIVALRSAGRNISETAKQAGCSESQVTRVWGLRETKKLHKAGSLRLFYFGQPHTPRKYALLKFRVF